MGDLNEARKRVMDRAGELFDEMVSRAGAGTEDTFDDIEAQAESRGRELTRTLMQARLAVEEMRQGEQALCARCGVPMRRPATAATRNLETASGDVRYQRRHAICDRCHRSFSPSGSPPEDSTSRPLEPPATQGV